MKVWIMAVSTLAVSVTVAFAYTATLDDFKEAVKHRGCESIKDLKSQRDDLNSKRSDAKDDDERKKLDDQIAAIGEQIDKLEKKIDEMKHKLDEEKHQIEDRIYIGQHCLDARSDVQDKFDRARTAADGESDEAIKPLARQLIDLWDKGSDDHKKISADTKTAVEQCKSFR